MALFLCGPRGPSSPHWPAGRIAKNAVLRSGSILGNSERSFGLRLIADQTFIFSAEKNGPIFRRIRGTAAENEQILKTSLRASSGGLVPDMFEI